MFICYDSFCVYTMYANINMNMYKWVNNNTNILYKQHTYFLKDRI